jgi:nucleotide-binding universal stress UspA family protein
MTLVVGFAPDGRGRAVLHLAAMLARSRGDELVVCAVIPQPWPPSPARVDAEYREYLEGAARAALEQARARLPSDLPADYMVKRTRSAPAGLLELAEERDASAIVVGSAASGGAGQVTLGGTTSRLLHSSPVPVAIAPRGFRARPGERVRRVTAAFGGTEAAEELVVAAAGVTSRVGATLRLAALAVRPRPPYTAGVGRGPELQMVAEWEEEIRAAARATLERVADLPAAPTDVEIAIGHGESWDEALEDVEWDDGDVLVVGSSSSGPLARVFLGSRASKIVRNSPVPVVVVPRAAVAELAEEAERGAG